MSQGVVLALVTALMLPVWGDARTDALYQAAQAGDLSKVEELLGQGVQPDAAESSGNTPLHAAALQGHKPVVERLLAAGVKADSHHRIDQATPLHYAVTANHADIVQVLLDHGADPGATYGDGLSALHLAAGRGFSRIVEVLILRKVPLNPRSGNGATPLEDAVRRGSSEVVKMLLEAGADAKAPNPRTGQTPLHLAAGMNLDSVATVLLDHGVPATALDRNGYTPLEIALQYQRRDMINLLLDRGTPFDIAGALKASVLRGQIQTLRLLINRVTPDLGVSLLSDAAVKGYRDIVLLLLDNKVPVDGRNSDGASPMHDAALGGNVEVASLILSRGGNLNARDRDANATPLHVAASWGRKEMVRFLLSSGADATLTDKTGKTALELAVANQQTEIANLLRNPGNTKAKGR